MKRGARELAWTSCRAFACVTLIAMPWARAAEPLPSALEGVTVDEHLGQPLDPELVFTDHTGKRVRLGDYFDDGVPVILTLNYYTCGTLCSVVLNGVTDGLRQFDWSPGDHYRVLTVSIDPTETSELAATKRASYLQSLGKGDVDWSFLVGEESQIQALAGAVGFRYHYDEATQQYAHPAVISVISPGGAVARYLYGFQFPERDLKFAVMEAAEGRAGSPIDKLILSCFHYDSTAGRYTPAAFGVMRLGGVLSLIGLGGFTLSLWRREHINRSRGSST